MPPSALRVFRRSMSVGLGAEAALGLRAHLERAAEAVEVVHVDRAEVDLQRVEDVAERHVQLLRLHAVDVGEELRRAGAEGGEDAATATARGAPRRPARRWPPAAPGSRARRGPATSSLKPPAVPRPAHRRRRDDEDAAPPGSRTAAAAGSAISSVAVGPCAARSSNGFGPTKMAPAFDAVGARRAGEARRTRPRT